MVCLCVCRFFFVQVPEGSGEQGKMEETGCKIICGAPTTLAVKGLMRWDERQLWSLGSQFRPVKLLLVMKYWCAIMNLREKRCTKRRKSASNRKKEIHLRRGQCTRYSSTRAESCFKKNSWRREKKSLTGKYYRESVLAEVSRFDERVRPNSRHAWFHKLLHD